MDHPETSAYEDTSLLYCPTCGKPKDQVVEALEDECVVLKCLKCNTALAAGHFISFKAICPGCNHLVIVGSGS